MTSAQTNSNAHAHAAGQADRRKSPPPAIRDWIAARRKIMAIVAAAIVLGSVLIAASLLSRARKVVQEAVEHEERVTLEMAYDALDTDYYANARRFCKTYRAQNPGTADERALAFIQGAAVAGESDDLWGQEQRNYALLAARYLQKAEAIGFPPEREAQGLFLLGKCLIECDDLVASRPYLERALKDKSPRTVQIHQLLARAYCEGSRPNLPEAYRHLEAIVDDVRAELGQRLQAQLVQAQIALQLGDEKGSLAVLERISQSSDLPNLPGVYHQMQLLRGRLQLNRAQALRRMAADKPEEERVAAVRETCLAALDYLKRSQDDPLAVRTTRQAMYLIGVCHLEMGETKTALNQFERTRKLYLRTPEGLAAGLQEADLLRREAEDDRAVAGYRRVLRAVKPDAEFVNQWIPPDEFRQRVLDAFQHYAGAGQYERAVALAERFFPLFPENRGKELVAETFRDQARLTLQNAEHTPDPQGASMERSGREMMRRAGAAFDELATLDFTTNRYPEHLWEAAESHRQGFAYPEAAKAYESYLRNELRRRQPIALTYLGQSLLAQGLAKQAIDRFAECISYYPRDAATYQSRLYAAQAYLQLGEDAKAEALLRDNLNGELLTPDSREWRDSLFALGKLLQDHGRYEEAIARLEEAVARYPDSRQAVEARYLIASSYVQSARDPQAKARSATIESARLALLKQVQLFLASAIRNYQQVQLDLTTRQERTELTPLEQAMLRNAYFAVGACLFDLGKYDEAIAAYSMATNRYQHEPQVLDGFVQIAACYRRLNKPIEARGALQQARVVLQRLKPEISFVDATAFDRDEWSKMLDWMDQL